MRLERRQVVSILTLLLCVGFMATAIVNYMAARQLIRNSIIESELPLTSDNIYSEIQKDLVRPIFVSSMMAGDTFLRDWIMAGEKDIRRITRYLAEIRRQYGAHTSFLISDRSRNYYQADGLLKQIQPEAERDTWYYRVRGMKKPYEINVDVDMANRDALTIFVNYRVFDYNQRFIGATGVGLAVDSVRKLINEYQQRYQRTIYFVDPQGRFVLSTVSHAGKSLHEVAGLGALATQVLDSRQGGAHEYRAADGTNRLLNVRYIPELHWYLLVEKEEDAALGNVRQTLYLNLLISLAITALVLYLVNVTMGRYQTRLETMAMTDKLTGLANRQALDMFLLRDMAEFERSGTPLALLLFDLDHFKDINDRHGHLAGDAVLSGISAAVQAQLRESDVLGRWGGEEFIILLRNADLQGAIQVAEKVRRCVEETRISHGRVQLGVSCSVGVAALRSGDSMDRLLSRVDHALYAAKQQGRNRISTALEDTAAHAA